MKKNQLFYFLISLVIAFGIWAYVVTVVSPESEATFYNIPVVLNNESILRDKGLMVVSDAEPTVTLKLRGNRSDLNKLTKSDITVIADLAKINKAGEAEELPCTVSFAGGNAFEILNQDPGQITLEIAHWSTKDVDVVPYPIGTVDPSCIDYWDELILDREKITITGPKTVVDQITQARVGVDLYGKTETVSESTRFTLCDKANKPVDASDIKTDAAEVHYTVKILRTKTLELIYNVNYAGGATKENTTITLNYKTIVVAGSDSILAELGDTLLLGTVDLTVDTEEKVFTITEGMLKGAENRSRLWEVTATITLPELENRVVKVPAAQVKLINCPEGMTPTVVPVWVEVTVRGYAEQLAGITAENLTVTVDLTGAALGINALKAEVVLSADDSESVSVIGVESIDVEMAEIVFSGGTP